MSHPTIEILPDSRAQRPPSSHYRERVDYISSLRAHVGSAPLIMACAGCAVLDDGRVLLQQRPTGEWGLPGGAMELGESVEDCAVRETLEETGVKARPIELLGVYTGAPHTYSNGDIVHSVVTVLVADLNEERLRPEPDTETSNIGWFDLDAIPEPIFTPHQQMLSDLVVGKRAVWI